LEEIAQAVAVETRAVKIAKLKTTRKSKQRRKRCTCPTGSVKPIALTSRSKCCNQIYRRQ